MVLKHEIGALILRVVLGITFFIHGFVKFQGGIENQVAWFSSIGLPGFLAYVVAIIELVGGFALIIGFGTKIISVLISFLMIGATLKVKLSLGFLGNGQMAGYELDVVLLAMAVYLAINGSKLWSVGQLIFQKESENFTKAS
jgi:putative oxidoreductase